MFKTHFYKGLALLQILAIPYLFVNLTPILWPLIKGIIEEINLDWFDSGHVIFFTIWHALVFCAFNLSYYPLYALNIPFFDQYKVNKEPWPW